MLRKIVGVTVIFAPFIAIFLYFLFTNPIETIFIVAGVIAFLDLAGWAFWFYVLGMTIINGEKIR